MPNWVEVLERMLRLYHVKTQQELGMALGVPVHVGMEIGTHDLTIPWQILELAVADKRVSWDWLLTGRNFQEDGRAPGKAAAPASQPARESDPGKAQPVPREQMPHFETMELIKALLPRDGRDARPPDVETPDDPAAAIPSDTPRSPEAPDATEPAIAELERIKESMLREIGRVEELLAQKTGPKPL